MNNEKTKLSFDLKKIKENENIELKKADNNLPNSLWKTYSAFCNTSGGIVILGIEEEKNGDNIIIGINDIDKMEKDIWNTANNSAKVSYNVIENGRSTKYEISFGTQGYLTKIQMKLQTLAKLNNLLSED